MDEESEQFEIAKVQLRCVVLDSLVLLTKAPLIEKKRVQKLRKQTV